LYYTASGIITPVGGRPVHRLRQDWLTSLLSTCAPDGHLQVWWYQVLYITILTSWWWAHSARNMYRRIINLLKNKISCIKLVITKIKTTKICFVSSFLPLPRSHRRNKNGKLVTKEHVSHWRILNSYSNI